MLQRCGNQSHHACGNIQLASGHSEHWRTIREANPVLVGAFAQGTTVDDEERCSTRFNSEVGAGMPVPVFRTAAVWTSGQGRRSSPVTRRCMLR